MGAVASLPPGAHFVGVTALPTMPPTQVLTERVVDVVVMQSRHFTVKLRAKKLDISRPFEVCIGKSFNIQVSAKPALFNLLDVFPRGANHV